VFGGAHCPTLQISVTAARADVACIRTVRVVSSGPEVDRGKCPNFSFFWFFALDDMFARCCGERYNARRVRGCDFLVAAAASVDMAVLSRGSMKVSICVSMS
jgi:hypothetical protein